MKLISKTVPIKLTQLSIAVALATSAFTVQAMEVDFGNRDIKASWSNTLKYSAAWRIKGVDDDVSGTNYNPTLDGGDHNFDKGLISNRIDVLSEFDLKYKRNLGFRISAAGWYDDIYHQDTDSDLTILNAQGTPNSKFTDETQKVNGGDVELLDMFVYGRTKVGGGYLTAKLGQLTHLYGESLFFGANGIADAQANPDVIKALSVPSAQFKEIMRPIGQVTLNYQISPRMSVGAYNQFEWEKARLPGIGSYFSNVDHVGPGSNYVYGLGKQGKDIEASDSGQFGMQFKYRTDTSEYGLYATRHHSKFPQLYLNPTNPASAYKLVFAEDIEMYGVSVSTVVADTSVAAELSYRRNMPLNAYGSAVVDLTGSGDGKSNPLYPVGNTIHFNLSSIALLGGSQLWDGASFAGEFAFNYLESIDKNADQLDPNSTRSASALRFTFTPEYFQVFEGVDLQVPIGLGYGVHGRSSVSGNGGLPGRGTGDVSIGVNADFAKKWQGGLGYTHYLGQGGGVVKADGSLSYDQTFKDRDFISFNIRRTF